MTATPQIQAPIRPVETVTITIDGLQVDVPKGTLVIRAAEQVGIQIPRFCDHPLLDPVGACRQCLVEVSTPGPDGALRAMPKPQASCTLAVSPGMVIKTQLTSSLADKAQQGVMELLLINHPLDCPVCDKGGECPLQNQALSNGREDSRFADVKRTYPKPVPVSSQVLLDRERCVLCARCTRFSQQVAGDPFIELVERGALQQVGIYAEQPFESYFSGNTVQICPVGALTGAAYRFRSRPFDLVSTPSTCEHCASGCSLRVDARRGKVLRRLAGDDPAVNEEWNCDKGRWAFTYATQDRLTTPMIRDEESGQLRPASWPEALTVAARGLAAARDAGGVGVLPGGRLTEEDSYAYAKFARMVLATNDIDLRARPHSAEETQFLAAHVAGSWGNSGAGNAVTYADIDTAPVVLLVGFEPEEESPIVFLRLRKAVRSGQRVVSVAPWRTRGVEKLSGELISAAPGTEAELLDALAAGAHEVAEIAKLLNTSGALIMVGERLAGVRGGLSAAARLAEATGARLAWVPRRAGERGSIEAGALPNLLPGGRLVTDPVARVDLQAAWGVTNLPTAPGRETSGIVAAAGASQLAGLLIGGVELTDLPDPTAARVALAAASFVVSLEQRLSAVTEYANVVFPVAAVAEKSGTFRTWEGRPRQFDAVLRPQGPSGTLSDQRVLHLIAGEAGVDLGLPDVASARAELAELAGWNGARESTPHVPAASPPPVSPGQAVLATWHLLLDAGELQTGEPWLAGTARRAVARLSATTAERVGVVDGDLLSVSTTQGAVTLPVIVTDLPDHVVWLPTNQVGYGVRAALGVDAGAVVTITRGGIG
ncbi:MAG: NADH-quinone oxidoreductase subunit G [Actinomycetota bacterium]